MIAHDLSDFLFSSLKTLARLCLRRGVKIQEVEEALKKAFISVAEEELLTTGSAISVSRVSLMTGIHRREIPRFLTIKETASPKEAGLLTRVIGQWQADRRFRGSGGKTKDLTFEGMESEFVSLVRSVNKEFNPYTVLFELERLGAVKRNKDVLVLQVEAFNPSGDNSEGMRLLSNDIADLVSAVTTNVFDKPTPPNLHIKTEYDNVCLDAVDGLRDWCLEKGGAFHEAARSHLSKYDKDLNPKLFKKEGGARIAIGTFSIVEFPTKKAADENK